jgi:potassium channel LctB
MGYTDVKDYPGGLEGWEEAGLPVERGVPMTGDVVAASSRARRPGRMTAEMPPPRRRAVLRSLSDRLLDQLSIRSTGWLMSLWVGMIVCCGLVYWGLSLAGFRILSEGGRALTGDLHGFLTSVYFSFVTATSIGFGDVVPLGAARALAICEAALGLLIFGCIVSKLVSNRQEMLIEETHRIAFEDRLGRVRTNLHLVLSDLHSIRAVSLVEATEQPGAGPRVTLPRIESVAMVFAGELRTVHDLLYRPQQAPEEPVLEAILASLTSDMQELRDLVLSAAPTRESRAAAPTLESSLHTIITISAEICGDCVPRTHSPALNVWMNRIQDLGRSLETS